MASTYIQVRADEVDKKLAVEILDELGTTLSAGVNMMLKQIILTRSIPFKTDLEGMQNPPEVASTLELLAARDTENRAFKIRLEELEKSLEKSRSRVEVKIARGLAQNSPARVIRSEVFEKEQGLSDEFTSVDETALHAVLYRDGEALACGRAYLEDKQAARYRLSRFAVRKPHRRQGLGSIVLESLEKASIELGAKEFVLDAQQQAIAFYVTHGYHPITQPFDIAGHPHVILQKTAGSLRSQHV
jgi:addiction module RelB/DinJ family antitoxin